MKLKGINLDDVMGIMIEYSNHLEDTEKSNEKQIMEKLISDLKLILSPEENPKMEDEEEKTPMQIESTSDLNHTNQS